MQSPPRGPESSPQSAHFLEPLFHPKSIAVVGASPEGNAGYEFVRKIQAAGFKGRIYPVNPKGEPILGLPAYPSISAIPDEVDFVIFASPAATVPALMEECVAKGVKLAHLFTARLSETGVAELADLERRIVEIARRGGIRILGSNGMGLYYPKEGISFRANYPREPGDVAFISQSGGNAWEFVYRSALRGLRFSKVISYGNACDLNEADYLEYLAQDPETRVITAYIEGVRGGRRFVEALQRAASAKPVVILKGGRTSTGARAIASHTASLAGDERVWEGLLRQAGALGAESLEELQDLAVAFRFFPRPRGRRAAVFGGGGGGSVAAADACDEAGFVLPRLPADVVEELKRLIPATWMMLSNPIDNSAVGNPQATVRLQEIGFRHKAFDLCLVEMGVDSGLEEEAGSERFPRSVNALIELHRQTQRPAAVVLRSADAREEWRSQAVNRGRERLAQAGLPVFPDMRRATRALGRVLDYWEEREEP